MSYKLEDISEKDQEKIINDSSADVQRRQRLAFLKKENDFTKPWAIDRERDCYLMSVPRPSFAEANATPYYFFFDGTMYLICSSGGFGPNFYFDPGSLPPELVSNKIEKEIAEAFRKYGRLGLGPQDNDPSILTIKFITQQGN